MAGRVPCLQTVAPPFLSFPSLPSRVEGGQTGLRRGRTWGCPLSPASWVRVPTELRDLSLGQGAQRASLRVRGTPAWRNPRNPGGRGTPRGPSPRPGFGSSPSRSGAPAENLAGRGGEPRRSRGARGAGSPAHPLASRTGGLRGCTHLAHDEAERGPGGRRRSRPAPTCAHLDGRAQPGGAGALNAARPAPAPVPGTHAPRPPPRAPRLRVRTRHQCAVG